MLIRSRRRSSLIESLESRTLLSTATPPPALPTPFLPTGAVSLPGTIEAENYDVGGQGVAYHDTTPGNSANQYRSDDVDIAAGGSNGFHVTNVAGGEWLKYTINVATPGTYRAAITYATSTKGGQVHFSLDGTPKTQWIALNGTGSDTNWKVATNSTLVLPGGTHVLKLMIDQANVAGQLVANIDFMKFTLISGPGTSTTFSPKPMTWKAVATNPLQREEAQSLVYGGYMYELGGYYDSSSGSDTASHRVDRYNPVTNKWTRMNNMPYAITHAAVAPDPDGHDFWFIGGFEGSFTHNPAEGPPASDKVYEYNAATDTWTQHLSLPSPRGAGGAGIVNGNLYFFAGADVTRTIDEPETYMLDLSNQSAGWQDVASVPNPRNHLGGIVVNGKIYAIGGQHGIDDNSVAQDEVDLFDPSTDTWTQVASLPTPLSHYNAATVLYNRYIITVGGENPHNTAKPYVFAYDTVLNKWARLTDLPDARRAGVAGVIGSTLIQSSGYDAGKETSTTWIADLSNVFT